jgi:hypothetical protein
LKGFLSGTLLENKLETGGLVGTQHYNASNAGTTLHSSLVTKHGLFKLEGQFYMHNLLILEQLFSITLHIQFVDAQINVKLVTCNPYRVV